MYMGIYVRLNQVDAEKFQVIKEDLKMTYSTDIVRVLIREKYEKIMEKKNGITNNNNKPA